MCAILAHLAVFLAAPMCAILAHIGPLRIDPRRDVARVGEVHARQFLLTVALVLAVTSCQRGSAPLISGTIEADEVHVGSRYGGRVERVFAREGDSVTNRQLIVELEAAELVAAHESAAA